jgi:hypothetical protein
MNLTKIIILIVIAAVMATYIFARIRDKCRKKNLLDVDALCEYLPEICGSGEPEGALDPSGKSLSGHTYEGYPEDGIRLAFVFGEDENLSVTIEMNGITSGQNCEYELREDEGTLAVIFSDASRLTCDFEWTDAGILLNGELYEETDNGSLAAAVEGAE